MKRDRTPMMSNEYGMKPFETLHLSIWGRKRSLLNEILENGTYKYYAKLTEIDLGGKPTKQSPDLVRLGIILS